MIPFKSSTCNSPPSDSLRNLFSTNDHYNHSTYFEWNYLGIELDDTENIFIDRVPYLRSVRSLRKLLSKGCNINATNRRGVTLLHMVCLQESKEGINLLLRYKPLMNVSYIFLGTPLHIFLECNLRDHRILKKMLHAGADPNMKDPSGDAALHIEVFRRSPEKKKKFIQLLTKYKADIDMRNRDGFTPLHLAIKEGYEDVVHTLLRKGAHINIEDSSGTTQMKSAFSYRFENPTILSHLGKHLILQHGRKMPVNLDDLEKLCEIELFRNYKITCDKEISALKQTTICPNSYLTYFDILMASPDKMAKYVRNLDIVESLKNFDRKIFLYGNHIIRNFKLGMRRRKTIEKIEQFCKALLPTLPEPCIYKISEFLDNEDIKSLQVFSNEKSN